MINILVDIEGLVDVYGIHKINLPVHDGGSRTRGEQRHP